MAKVEEKIITFRQNGGKEGEHVVSADGFESGEHRFGAGADIDEVSSNVFSLKNDKVYQDAQQLLARYELEESDSRILMTKLSLEIEPLQRDVRTEEKKIDENLGSMEKIKIKLDAAESYKKAGTDTGPEKRNRDIFIRQNRDMLQGRKQYHETTAIALGKMRIQLQNKEKEMHELRLRSIEIAAKIKLCKRMLKAHVDTLKCKSARRYPSRVQQMLAISRAYLQEVKANDIDVSNITNLMKLKIRPFRFTNSLFLLHFFL